MSYYFFRILNSIVGIFSVTVFFFTHLYFTATMRPGEEFPQTNGFFLAFDIFISLLLCLHFISQLILAQERHFPFRHAGDIKNFVPLLLMAVGLMAVLFHLYGMFSQSPMIGYSTLPNAFSTTHVWSLFWGVAGIFFVYDFYLVIKTFNLCGFKFFGFML